MTRGRFLPTFLLALVLGALLAGGNIAVAQRFAPDLLACQTCVAWMVGQPVLMGVILALALALRVPAAPASLPAPVAAKAAPPPPPDDTPALRLLAALQADGRLVDFLLEDIEGFTDDQIGAAVRGIHGPARKALRECVTLEPVIAAREEDEVTVGPDLDRGAVRLVGNVHGDPPFRGMLKHPGWKATAITLPPRRGQDERVIAPAEVEIA
jgi:hypothetical protein